MPKVCEWQKVTFAVWHFQSLHRHNPRVYAEVVPPDSAQSENHRQWEAKIRQTDQFQEFPAFEEAKAWVETEVGKLFKVYK